MKKIKNNMKKTGALGLLEIILSGLSGAIGVEIFVLLNYAYFHLAGTAVIFALALGGVINLLMMLSYCELGAAMPLVGGEYTYIKSAYGGYVGFIFGCFRWLAAIFAAALAAVAFVFQISYLVSGFSSQIQTALLNQSWIIAIAITAIMGIMEIRGSRKIGSLIVVAFVLLFVGFIIGGFIHGFVVANLFAAPLPLGASGVFAAVVYVFPMFIGTKALVSSAPAAERPEKAIPRALILSAIILIPLYLLLALVAVGTVNPSGTFQQIPLLNLAANNVFGSLGGVIFSIAGMVACLSTLGTALSVQSSIARGMSRDGYLPKLLLSVSSRYGTFYIAAIVGSLLIMALSTLGAIPFLGYAASFGSLLVFALVNLSLIKLRKTKPYMDRPFKTPLYPLTPILGIVLSLSMLVAPILLGDGNASEALVSSIGLTAIVLAFYYLRMAGRLRAQIALGGVGIGIGLSLLAINIADLANIIQPLIAFIPDYLQIILSVILIVTGYFNLTAHGNKSTNRDNEIEELITKLKESIAKRFKFLF